MRLLRYLFPFALIFLLYLSLPHILASSGGNELFTFNGPENGALILNERARNQRGQVEHCDTYFIGTSRTMADFDPSLFADLIQEANISPELSCATNLGNLGNSAIQLSQAFPVDIINPDLVIVEFSPHTFFTTTDLQAEKSAFTDHSRNKQYIELTLDGWLRKSLHLEGTLQIDPAALYIYANQAGKGLAESTDLYPFLATSYFGAGQRFQGDGQVWYRSYFKDSDSARGISEWVDTSLNDFEQSYSETAFSEAEWEAFLDFVQSLGNKRVVIVRPPVSEDLYKFENDELGEPIEKLRVAVKQMDLFYIDINPNDFFSLDESHVDWYETPRLTESLFYWMESWLRKHFSE